MLKDEFMERLKVHKVKNAKLQQSLGECKRELETYRKGFIEQVDMIKELKEENERLKNKRFETCKDSLGEFGQGKD